MTLEWSLLAQIDYWSNIDYLENEWSEKDVVAFIEQVDHCIDLLVKNNIFSQKPSIEMFSKL